MTRLSAETTPITTEGVIYGELSLEIDVPARDDPLCGTACRPTLLVAPYQFTETVRALNEAFLTDQKIAVADMDGIGWRTGHRTGGRTEQGSVPKTPEAALGCLGVALGRINEAPLNGESKKEVHFFWTSPCPPPGPTHHYGGMMDPAPEAASAVTTESFHVYRQMFERHMPGEDLFGDNIEVTIHYTEDAWGSTPFTTLNCETFSDVHKEAIDWLRDGDKSLPWWHRRLAHHLKESPGSAVLALAVLHLARDRGVRFLPMVSPRGVVQEMYGSAPESDQQHKVEVELWPEMGGQALLRGAAPHLHFRTLHIDRSCHLSLRASGDPTAGAQKHRLRAVVTAPKGAHPQRKAVRFALWAPLSAGGDSAEASPPVVVRYVSDMSHRGTEAQYLSITAAPDLAPLPDGVARDLARIHAGIDSVHRASYLVGEKQRGQREKALEACRLASATFYETLIAPECGERAAVAALLSGAQAHFAGALMSLQRDLQEAFKTPPEVAAPPPPPHKKPRLAAPPPHRMSSMGSMHY